MPQKPSFRMNVLAGTLLLCMLGLIVQLMRVQRGDRIAEAGVRQGKYHLHVPLCAGTIYDRNLNPLNNSEEQILAVVNPTPETISSIYAKIRDKDALTAQLQRVSPFVCNLTEAAPSSQNLIVLHGRCDAAGARPAQHLLGYAQNGERVAGLERAYADWLAECDAAADITFTVSGVGEVLAGADSSFQLSGKAGGGILTTLDLRVQEIAERALSTLNVPGAAVVLDCHTGDILACASLPAYAPDDLAAALDAPDAPFVNRALSAYSVGSVFKLVIAAAALENGFNTQYRYDCTGQINIYGQRFRCHKWNGHGLLNMENALIHSCNPYFISLTRILPADILHDTASALGFGEEISLADSLGSVSGTLQSVRDLQIDAEKANFSFGQGKLLATPLQVAAMTACIANDGVYCVPRLVIGKTPDGITAQADAKQESQRWRVLRSENAAAIREMMTAVLEKSDSANGKPYNTRAGGKTSTAQTGQFDETGTELCHAWMTGFFPADTPQYAVTVFAENGGSGNETAAPVFRAIIEAMMRLQ